MSRLITRPIGSRFVFDGVKLEVVENTHGLIGLCGGTEDPCFFCNETGCDDDHIIMAGECATCNRSDNKDVYFREVKS